MIYRLTKSCIKALIILFFIVDRLSVSKSNNLLNNSMISSYEESFPSPELANIQKETMHGSAIGNHDVMKIKKIQKKSTDKINRQGAKVWDQWGSWSKCSVTCGVGKLTRWRHCIGGSCLLGEKKAQIRTCTLSAC